MHRGMGDSLLVRQDACARCATSSTAWRPLNRSLRCEDDAMSDVVTMAVVGAGGRGTSYSAWVAEHPERAKVVAVADPDPVRRQRLAQRHAIADGAQYTSWNELAEQRPAVDAVLICTQDNLHTEPALRFIADGYHVLLEKPMAPTEAECTAIAEAAQRAGVVFAVGHVLRYTPYTQKLKRLLDAGAVGEVMSVSHLEPVGWWHMAHSFVRGNWRNEAQSSSMLLAKSCHDLDWLQYILGRSIVREVSFGRLSYFNRAHQPADAADRCLECPLQNSCAYSATRIYLEPVLSDPAAANAWPVSVLTSDASLQGVELALRKGPYGRCVWACDNDVVDHQVVAMEFDGGATGTFTMTGFTEMADRKTRIFGTHGELVGDGDRIEVFDFRTRERSVVHAHGGGDATARGGHGGGDAGLMDAFVAAVSTGDRSRVLSDAAASLASHRAVFAAERSRREGVTVQLV